MTKLPSPLIMYRAFMKRDSTYEGIFNIGVKTTGIFCRPTCPAKKPKVENVEFFASSHDALKAGYRPCSRCHPLDSEKQVPDLVKRLIELLENQSEKRITDSDLQAMKIDPSTARRQFKRYFGISFQAYQKSKKMGDALKSLKNGESVIGAQISSGYQSASGFWEAFKQVFGIQPSKSTKVNCLLAKRIETPLGAMLALADDQGLHLLEFADRKGLKNQILRVRKYSNSFIVPGNNKYLEQIHRELKVYFNGTVNQFSVPLVIHGTPFEENVWNKLCKIPYGETWSYAQLAQKIGKPSAIRAVGNANGRNRLAIVIPCHRVIRADGSLCGYGGGVWRKKWLLEHEKKN